LAGIVAWEQGDRAGRGAVRRQDAGRREASMGYVRAPRQQRGQCREQEGLIRREEQGKETRPQEELDTVRAPKNVPAD
jgi:hypothetical protein